MLTTHFQDLLMGAAVYQRATNLKMEDVCVGNKVLVFNVLLFDVFLQREKQNGALSSDLLVQKDTSKLPFAEAEQDSYRLCLLSTSSWEHR